MTVSCSAGAVLPGCGYADAERVLCAVVLCVPCIRMLSVCSVACCVVSIHVLGCQRPCASNPGVSCGGLRSHASERAGEAISGMCTPPPRTWGSRAWSVRAAEPGCRRVFRLFVVRRRRRVFVYEVYGMHSAPRRVSSVFVFVCRRAGGAAGGAGAERGRDASETSVWLVRRAAPGAYAYTGRDKEVKCQQSFPKNTLSSRRYTRASGAILRTQIVRHGTNSTSCTASTQDRRIHRRESNQLERPSCRRRPSNFNRRPQISAAHNLRSLDP